MTTQHPLISNYKQQRGANDKTTFTERVRIAALNGGWQSEQQMVTRAVNSQKVEISENTKQEQAPQQCYPEITFQNKINAHLKYRTCRSASF